MTERYNGIPLEGTNRPLSPKEATSWLSRRWNTFGREIAATVPLMTGLKPVEIAHLTASHFLLDSDPPVISIPPSQPCKAGPDGEPCHRCRESYDGVWEPQSPNQPRRVPIHDSYTHQLLTSYKCHNTQPIGKSTASLTKLSFERPVSGAALRHTYGIALAAKGFSRSDRARFLGLSEKNSTLRAYDTTADWDRYDGLAALGTGEFRE